MPGVTGCCLNAIFSEALNQTIDTQTNVASVTKEIKPIATAVQLTQIFPNKVMLNIPT